MEQRKPSPLPPPRAVLNNLLKAIAAIPLDNNPPPPESKDHPKPQTSNPLSQVPQPHRHLIVTLHVLFPDLLLPALDLLDRRLVARVTLLNHPSPNPNSNPTPNLEPPPETKTSFFLVRSAQPQRPRRRHHHHHHQLNNTTETTSGRGGGRVGIEKEYAVHIQAWNCTCAAFAFAFAYAAFPPDRSINHNHPEEEDEEKETDGMLAGDGDEEDLEFGGMSLGAQSPVCKHLLACLLAERWKDALGGYVVERQVSREEMAGIVADI
ncbi:hypothetical protein QBC47DRAFT_383671 [Echria macrotheca]|uniref:SWIM-type domain-containing protein n=1 Tax=Echria macrotheca TaxID=438768 RepID=A0AAJ0FAN0_9PEZI|nr:hypothetical protein QBC47DRAFT_383671 [Echria macrotheca]